MYKTNELFDLEHTLAKPYLEKYEFPWTAIPEIKSIIIELIKTLDKEEYVEIKENVWIHKTVKVFESAYIDGPTIIGKGSEVRHCAFIRGSALIGENCVIGNSCEIKNAIIFDNSEVPHFNYIGDSILGFHAHFGAGSVTSNIRSDRKDIIIKDGELQYETSLRKIGALVGDYAEIGCNAVLNPGTILGRNTMVYPTSCVRGVIDEDHIYKVTDEIVPKQ